MLSCLFLLGGGGGVALPQLHPGDQRDQQRPGAHAPRLQLYRPLRRPGAGSPSPPLPPPPLHRLQSLGRCCLSRPLAARLALRLPDVRVPLLRSRQGGGKRPGAFAAYLEPWHADVFDFLDLRKNTGSEEHRARDLFYALWIPDLFMRRVEAGGAWSLFCPCEAPGLSDAWGEEFERLYERYEAEGRARRQVRGPRPSVRVAASCHGRARRPAAWAPQRASDERR